MQAAFHAFRQRPLQRDTLLMLSAETLYRLSGFVLLMVLSRYLPAEEIGVYFFALSFAQIFLVFASFGLTPILMRRVAAEPQYAALHLSTLLAPLANSWTYRLDMRFRLLGRWWGTFFLMNAVQRVA